MILVQYVGTTAHQCQYDDQLKGTTHGLKGPIDQQATKYRQQQVLVFHYHGLNWVYMVPRIQGHIVNPFKWMLKEGFEPSNRKEQDLTLPRLTTPQLQHT